VPVIINLLHSEFHYAVQTALLRMAVSKLQGNNHASTYQRGLMERLEQEVIGACGEMACAKYLDCYHLGRVNTFHNVLDVGMFEVRATKVATGCLILRDNDSPTREYMLIVGEPPRMTVVGHIKGADGMRDCYLRDPGLIRKAWFVPQSALIPLGDPQVTSAEA